MSILKPGTNCRGIYRVHQSGLLVDARDYYGAFHRSALRARHYILLAGWQFDSEVRLVRGRDAVPAAGDARLLNFLENLC